MPGNGELPLNLSIPLRAPTRRPHVRHVQQRPTSGIAYHPYDMALPPNPCRQITMPALSTHSAGNRYIDRSSTLSTDLLREVPEAAPPPMKTAGMNMKFASTSWPIAPSRVHPSDMLHAPWLGRLAS